MRRLALCPLAVVALLAARAPAQDVLFDFSTGWPTTVAGGADLDLDGVPDVLLGVVPHQALVKPHVEARSGADGSLIWQAEAPVHLSKYASQLELVGDVGGDGVQDVFVGASQEFHAGQPAGSVHLYSGRDGALLHAVTGAGDEQLGWAVGGAGDLDADGVPDLLMVSRGAPDLGSRVTLLSGASKQALVVRIGDEPGDLFGEDVAGVGDVDGDGVLEVAIGAPGAEPAGWPGDADVGSVSLHSGPRLRRLSRLFAEGLDGQLGRRVAYAGDMTGDGLPDVLAARDGAIFVLHGADLQIHSKVPALNHAPEVVTPGDVDGDGLHELLMGIGQPGGKSAGLAELWAAEGTAPLLRVTSGITFSQFGLSVSAAGDVDRDGIPDFAVGALGFARVISGRLRPVQSMGGGLGDGQFAPVLVSDGLLLPGQQLVLQVLGGPADGGGWLVFGSSLAATPFQGGVLLPSPDVVLPVELDNAGGLVYRAAFPVGVPAGALVIAQAWFASGSGAPGFLATNGLSLSAP